LIKKDLISTVANRLTITKTKAAVSVGAVFDSLAQALSRGERIELRGFGVFEVREKKKGIGRNPRTKEEVSIPEGRAIRFKPGKELKKIK
jgi:DNA-binding protein HU-beta